MADFYSEVLAPLSCPAQLMEMETAILCPSDSADYVIQFSGDDEGN